MSPAVSIVLPVKDGSATLGALLDALATQETDREVETVALDSASTDGSRELLAGRVDRVIDVPPAEFDHGGTRNLGIAAARGDLVVLLVQDALPQGRHWLRELLRPLDQDPRIAGSWARQVPRPEASALARHALTQWTGSRDTACVRELTAAPGGTPLDALAALTPAERHQLCAFDNVCSCIRRRVWEQHPFPVTPIAEDLEWARAVLLAGHRLAYAPAAVVTHSHDRPVRYELRRTFLVHQRLRALFGLAAVPHAPDLARAIASSAVLHARLVARDPRPRARTPTALARAMALAVAWPLGQYLGARAADHGVAPRDARGAR